MESLLTALHNAPTPIALVIRHGARYPATDLKNEMAIGLTETGMAESRMLGEKLTGFASVRLFHSPALRCRQTAECIAEGLRTNNITVYPPEERASLCAPYVKSAEVMESVSRLGQDFIKEWFESKLNPEWIYSTEESVKMIAGPILESLSELHKGDLDIHISHDWDITLMWKELANTDYKTVGWPGYLSGLLFTVEGETVKCIPVDAPRLQ
ncbi:histidine phosphatase family protein [Candidatus Methanomassiliicoccus intestinalis]|uniref:histidine phosphatase family protein n=1 Tax=Candidatus Methanomassiliicoccus intestinalis TaxID=1406512 RepID=UPI0037DD3AF1